MKTIFWYLKQLFPLTYRSHYQDGSGNQRFAVWRMWFGRVFAHENYALKVLALLGLTLLMAAPATAQLIAGADAGATFVFRGQETFRAPDLTLSAEWRVNDAKMGLVGYYGIAANGGPGQLAGLGVRYYFGNVAGGAIRPGLGGSAFVVGPAENEQGEIVISKDTFLLGPEAMIELPAGDGDAVMAWLGFYPAMRGDRVNIVRFGLRAAFN